MVREPAHPVTQRLSDPNRRPALYEPTVSASLARRKHLPARPQPAEVDPERHATSDRVHFGAGRGAVSGPDNLGQSKAAAYRSARYVSVSLQAGKSFRTDCLGVGVAADRYIDEPRDTAER